MIFIVILIHITAGAIVLLTGFTAIVAKKGNAFHRQLGNVYVVSMLTLGISGTIIAVVRYVPISIMNGLVLCYFVLSAINVIRQPDNQTNLADRFLFCFATLLFLGLFGFAYQTMLMPDGKLGGFGTTAYVIFGSVLAFCSVADYRYIKLGGLQGKDKLIRHLWRMFFPLFMSTAAFFLGQAIHIPEAIRTIEFLLTPVAFVILTAVYWVFKVKWNLKIRKFWQKGS
ncbi:MULTISPECIES: DUF2306 domain-containing protein [Pseudoalteromonas]|uniref:DUF2306 domain-containing protein n=1 Tax=Pseudoalteromonas amylolytica TaxID=1859457 RepID=A0A1S1ML54_9GAMM|nr:MULTISPECIES: DUF2306 domain-containing protein [Pseudoalteromonas]OHU85687.1 hypothetical protein BFC16_17340 [Pseudoalteromonas sp. JW3]OHU87410.1 hypothetical protein BET10_21040 [Pseudoalteromonas amylolytica]